MDSLNSTQEMNDANTFISIQRKSWNLASIDERLCLAFQQKLSIPEIIARLLCTRNVPFDSAHDYLNPTLRSYLPNPLHLNDMIIAVNRIIEAIIKQQKVVIFGDYDVDGATSSALLKRFLAQIGLETIVYIPDRIEEGYGPNIQAFQKFKDQDVQLIITVDCGTSAFIPIKAAVTYNIDVIVIDHHLGGDSLPEAIAVVNPNRYDEVSEHKYLAAVGVTFLLVVAINSELRARNWYNTKQEPDLFSLLDLVALGTVCDVVPLQGINRAFVTQGLKILTQRQNKGLAALCDTAGITETPDIYHLGYILGPRINAGGRVGKADLGSRLLSSDDYEQALTIAKQLDKFNSERKAIETIVLEEATIQATLTNDNNSPLTFVCGNNWHQGVIGIVAGRLKDKFNKPTAVISIEQGIGKASCRSVPGIDFGSAITSAKALGLLEEGGGHAMAAGFTVREEKLNDLRIFLYERFTQQLSSLSGNINKHFDGFISLDGLTTDLAKLINRIGPYGQGNPEPRFMIKNCHFLRVNNINNSHISCLLINRTRSASSSAVKAIAFNAVNSPIGELLLNSQGKSAHIIGYIRINRWQGTEKAELVIDDIIA